MADAYQDLEPGYLNLHDQKILDEIATHEFFIKFDDGEIENIGTIYNNNRLTIELDPKGGNPNPEITFTSKSGRKFSLGLKQIVK